jgi:hypothetical protein
LRWFNEAAAEGHQDAAAALNIADTVIALLESETQRAAT